MAWLRTARGVTGATGPESRAGVVRGWAAAPRRGAAAHVSDGPSSTRLIFGPRMGECSLSAKLRRVLSPPAAPRRYALRPGGWRDLITILVQDGRGWARSSPDPFFAEAAGLTTVAASAIPCIRGSGNAPRADRRGRLSIESMRLPRTAPIVSSRESYA